LILYGFNLNKRELINSMIIKISIEKFLKKPKFILSEYKFIIKENFFLKKDKFIGQIKAISNDLTKEIRYKILNETKNLIEINSLTGELFILNENLIENLNEINLLIQSFYLINKNLNSFINVKIFIRLKNKLDQILINYQLKSLFIKQLNNSNEFLIKKKNLSSNQILFNLSILSFYYPSDEFLLSILNLNSIFSLIPSSLKNNYLLKLDNHSELNSVYFLTIQIKHQLTNQYLSNLTIKFILQESSSSSSSILCLQNSTFHFYDFNKTNLIGKLKVLQTNSNISSFSNFLLSKNEILINECQMLIDELNSNLTESQYQLCSLSNQCFNISSLYIKSFSLKNFLTIRPIEIAIFIFSFIFILATITLILIIYRFNAFRLCLSIKNYLFYGKKYGLNNTQRISSKKSTVCLFSSFSLSLFLFSFSKEFIQLLLENLNLLRLNISNLVSYFLFIYLS